MPSEKERGLLSYLWEQVNNKSIPFLSFLDKKTFRIVIIT
jgi:hypothetical protein